MLFRSHLAVVGGEFLVETLPAYVNGGIQPAPQDPALATHARKLTKEDGRLEWTQPAVILDRKVRALRPWPGAYAFIPDEPHPKLLKVWRATAIPSNSNRAPGEILEISNEAVAVACGAGALKIAELQREGGKRMPAAEAARGLQLRSGSRLV